MKRLYLQPKTLAVNVLPERLLEASESSGIGGRISGYSESSSGFSQSDNDDN